MFFDGSKILQTIFEKGHPRNNPEKLISKLAQRFQRRRFLKNSLKNSILLPWQPEFLMESNSANNSGKLGGVCLQNTSKSHSYHLKIWQLLRGGYRLWKLYHEILRYMGLYRETHHDVSQTFYRVLCMIVHVTHFTLPL